jgi:hypothetical protein
VRQIGQTPEAGADGGTAIAASLIVSIGMMLLSGDATTAFCAADTAQDALSIQNYTADLVAVNNRLGEDPAYDFRGRVGSMFRFIRDNAIEDASLVDRYFRLFTGIVQNTSLNVSLRRWVALSELSLADAYHRLEDIYPTVRPVLLEALNDSSLDVRLETANRLYALGFRADAYLAYAAVLSKPNLREWLDSERRRQYAREEHCLSTGVSYLEAKFALNKRKGTYKHMGMQRLDSMEIERRKGALRDIGAKVRRIELMKVVTTSEILNKLISYSDQETHELVRRVVTGDPWVWAVVHNPLSLVDTTMGRVGRTGQGQTRNAVDEYTKSEDRR